jgi:hypothetical protein
MLYAGFLNIMIFTHIIILHWSMTNPNYYMS